MNFIDEKGFNELQGSLDAGATSNYEPSFTSGSAGALFTGAANGFAQVSSQAVAGGYNADEGAGALMGLVNADPYGPSPETIRENAEWASRTLRPDPQTTGTMAQILFGVGDVGTRFATGFAVGGVGGGALLSGGSVGQERYDELIREGVDPKTALGAAAIRGVTTGAGALLPAGFGASLLGRAVSGAAINTAAGIGGRAAEGTALNSYKQGDELKAFSAQDIAVDAILGSIFGGISRLGVDVTHDQYDAAMALKNAKSYNVDAMPGAPDTVGDIARHGKAMGTALDDILNDRTVSVDAEAAGVNFTPREMPALERAERAPTEGGELSYADIVKGVFDAEGYGRVYEEMTQAEARAAQIDRSQSQFSPGDAPDVVEPAAFRDINTESFRDLLPGDRVTPSRDISGLRAGEEVRVQSVDEQGTVQFSGPDGEAVNVGRDEAAEALDLGLEIRRPLVEEAQVPTEFGQTEPASGMLASAHRAIQEASTEGRAYSAAVDCFLSRGN